MRRGYDPAPALAWAWAILVFAIGIGGPWDISWDASFGRHSWYSPPHLLLNLSAVVALGLAGRQFRRQPGVALLATLGAGGMLAAEVHAEWFGVLPIDAEPGWSQWAVIAGMLSLAAAAVIASAGGRDRAAPAVACCGFLLLTATALSPYSLPNLQRTALFVQLSAAAYPLILAFAQEIVPRRAAASRVAFGYTLTLCLLVWLLPLWPARPQVQPVFQDINSLLPPRFPLLLILPALVLDVGRPVITRAGSLASLFRGVLFVATLVPAQWFFAAFLLAPASDHWFFAGGGQHWPFYLEIGAERGVFWGVEESPLDPWAIALAVLLATLSAALGGWLGQRLHRHTDATSGR